MRLTWGNKVSQIFCDRVLWIAQDLGFEPGDLMACMAFESARTFSPSIMHPKTRAVGLIQFMPGTAASLGTSTEALAAMTAEDQLNYVWKYFAPWKGRLSNLGDVYMAILWPGGVGKNDDYVLFGRDGPSPLAYAANKGLDLNANGQVLRAEATSKIVDHYQRGMEDGFYRDIPG